MNKPPEDPCIAVVCGGHSAEASVSRISGRGVAEALQKSFVDIRVLELDRHIAAALQGVDIVFPVLHGPPGEDGTFQGLLECLGIPYVGSGVLASACAMHKIVAKQIFRAFRIPVARDVIVHHSEDLATAAHRVEHHLGFPVVVKPTSQGSAIGVTFAHTSDDLGKALVQAFIYDERVLIEACIPGKEITCAILEREEPEALPVIEVRTPPATWYDFEHRYTPGLSEHIIPAVLTERQYQRVQGIAVRAHTALGCRDLSRVDFVVPEHGDPVVLEVNTLPGMTPTSLYPDAARAAGMSFEELVAYLVKRALTRACRIDAG